MSPGFAALLTFTCTPALPKVGSEAPPRSPYQVSWRLYQCAHQLSQRCRHFLKSSCLRNTTTTVPDDLRAAAPGSISRLRSWMRWRRRSASSPERPAGPRQGQGRPRKSLGAPVEAFCSCLLASAISFIFPRNSPASHPITTLTTSVSWPSTAWSRKNAAISFSSVASRGRPATMIAKSFGMMVMASERLSVLIWCWRMPTIATQNRMITTK
mmetsp:Transcript_36872/g.105367  ORF Transcript_36872/g.105367 Transcript_36872/m.105367 type:complete len:212 (-) Transcript_36872:962-1597(-)